MEIMALTCSEGVSRASSENGEDTVPWPGITSAVAKASVSRLYAGIGLWWSIFVNILELNLPECG